MVTRRTVVLGASSATIGAGRTATLRIGLNRAGRKVLASRHKLTAELTVIQRVAGRNGTIAAQKVTFRAPKRTYGGH
jgi:hypothetical protein